MKYKIIEKFGPGSEKWKEYAEWAMIEDCQEFYSIGSGMKPDLFIPETEEDWNNCINEDFKLNIITNLDFAKKIVTKFPNAEIVGVIENPKYSKEEIPAGHIFLGYDIIDGFNSVSLLTNWRGKENGIKNIKFNKYALVDDINYAYTLKEMLRRDFSKDDHAAKCEIWAVYKLKA